MYKHKARLTPRRREILILIAKGYNNDEIAKAMGLTLTNTKLQKWRLYCYLGDIHTAVDAVYMGLKERLLDESDKYEAVVCENCGMLAVEDTSKHKKYCPICGDVETYPVEISYAFKLLLDELKSLCIFPKLVLGDKA